MRSGLLQYPAPPYTLTVKCTWKSAVLSVIGLFGFKHDRKLALKALVVAASRNDTQSVFAGLVLLTDRGGFLLLSSYQANESRIVAEYQE
ncbi:Mitochondrial outer membrane protein IML2 [Leucoagaricus sp. SymC.cos]|nr:Mitochondrial outer membrane protein IML2 [Leucoagaricus sp. SymC.cos]